MQNKPSSDYYWVIEILVIKWSTIPNLTQFSDWMRNLAQTPEKANLFNGFNPFSYMVRNINGHAEHVNLGPETTISNWFKAVSKIGKHFDEENHRSYTLICIDVACCGLSYSGNHDTKKDRHATWKYPLEYYYGFINDKKNHEYREENKVRLLI